MQALRLRRALGEEMAAAMRDVDVLVTGITPGAAPSIDEKPGYESFQRPLMMPFNVTGQPSMAVRCGLSAVAPYPERRPMRPKTPVCRLTLDLFAAPPCCPMHSYARALSAG